MRFIIAFALCSLVGCDQGTPPDDLVPPRDAPGADPEALVAPANREGIDGGAVDGGGNSEAMSVTGAVRGRTVVGPSNPESPSAKLTDPARVLDGVSPWSNQDDAGVGPPSSTPEPDPSVGDVVDACSGCAGTCNTESSDSCDSGDSGEDPCATTSEDTSGDAVDPCASGGDTSYDNSADSCDTTSADSGSAESCDNTSSDSGEGCASSGDSSDAATCQVARGRGHKNSGTRIWLLAPLAYLLMVRRR